MRVIALLVVLPALLTLAGCRSPEDMVDAKVPREVQAALGVPPKVPLSAMPDIRAEYEALVEKQAAAKAEEAAAAARALSRQTRVAQRVYAERLAAVQREGEAALEAIADEGAAREAELAAAMERIKTEGQKVLARVDKLAADAQVKADSIRSMVSFGLNELVPGVAAAFPGVGLALPALTLLGGLFLKRPGEDKRIKEAADRAYDEGRRAALDDAALAARRAA